MMEEVKSARRERGMAFAALVSAFCAFFIGIGAQGAGSTAADIASYESGGELERDASEVVVEAPRDMKLVLCIGQSNMAGRGKMKDCDREKVPGAYKFNRDDKWVAACAPYHFDRAYSAVGPVDEFVRLYLKEHPGESLGVVPCAVGGSGVATWVAEGKKGPGKNFTRALERAKAAKANGEYIAILWHQGETDAAKYDARSLMKTYPGRVKGLAEALRAELGGEVPFIVGEIGRWQRGDGDHAAKINPCINKVAEVLPKCAVVSSEGLKNQDRHHFDRAGQIELGKRYYEAWKGLCAEAGAAAPAAPSQTGEK